MWDPDRYVDTDFGLTPNETFEPEDEDRANERLETLPHVMTVLGPISPDDLGVCQHAEYLLHGHGTDAGAPEVRAAADELEAYFTVGGRSMVDISLDGRARNVQGLRTLAQLVPVHIVAATGARPNGGPIATEIVDGVEGTGIRPGMVVSATFADLEINVAAAAATGLPHLVLLDEGDRLPELASRVEAAGGDIRRTLVSQSGASMEICLATLERGAWASLDRIGAGSDDQAAALISDLVKAGHGDRILLSQRLPGPAAYVTRGGQPGWIHILERFVLDLMAAGLNGDQVRSILVDNQARALTILPRVRDTL